MPPTVRELWGNFTLYGECDNVLDLSVLLFRVTTHLENMEKSGNWIVVREKSSKMEKVRESYNHHLAAAQEKDITTIRYSKHNQNCYLKTWRFDLYQRPLSEEAGTQYRYLNFSSHYPIEHKLSVVWTLLERSQCLVTESEDKKQEDFHVEEALRHAGIRSGLSTKWGARLSPRGTRRQGSNVILCSGQWSLFLMWKTFLKPLQE